MNSLSDNITLPTSLNDGVYCGKGCEVGVKGNLATNVADFVGMGASALWVARGVYDIAKGAIELVRRSSYEAILEDGCYQAKILARKRIIVGVVEAGGGAVMFAFTTFGSMLGKYGNMKPVCEAYCVKQ